ncbi:hypothetical protein DID75_00775 [Candidatus Marinamargulisbacteria bacterium SCGC AG-410-N11]|nr:hypothetical protein DID75_00775 [Candidatus Marinamargulisbacteria bacterium SCGC AG-410-N11]
MNFKTISLRLQNNSQFKSSAYPNEPLCKLKDFNLENKFHKNLDFSFKIKNSFSEKPWIPTFFQDHINNFKGYYLFEEDLCNKINNVTYSTNFCIFDKSIFHYLSFTRNSLQTKPLMILLAGLNLSSLSQYYSNIDNLLDHYNIIALDLLNSGGSSSSNEASISSTIDNLEICLAAITGSKPFEIVAHSISCFYAIKLVPRLKLNISKVLAFSPVGVGYTASFMDIILTYKCINFILKRCVFPKNKFQNILEYNAGRGNVPDHLTNSTQLAYSVDTNRHPLDCIINIINQRNQLNFSSDEINILKNKNTFLFFGETDTVVTDHHYDFAKSIGLNVSKIKTGHVPNLDPSFNFVKFLNSLKLDERKINDLSLPKIHDFSRKLVTDKYIMRES